VPFDKATIKTAPRYQSEVPLTPQDEDALYRHYNIPLGVVAARGTTKHGAAGYPPQAGRGAEAATGGPSTDDTLTRPVVPVTSAEPMTGRARLRKYVTTEQQTVIVPVSHEKVRLEREPITNQDRDQASGVELTEEEREIVLHAERPVVTTESVPIERVRLTPQP